MTYPRIIINTNIIKNNVKTLVDLCHSKDIGVAGVVKGVCAHQSIVNSFVAGGVDYLADSRIENLKKIQGYGMPKIMLRLPMISQVEDVVEYSDISLNSEIRTIRSLSKVAMEKNKKHGIILMIDLGDLREGYFCEEELYKTIEEIIELKGVKLIGIGTNLTCYGGIIPSNAILEELIEYKNFIESKYGIKLEIISGGNSSTMELVKKGLPKGINHLRLGEVLLLGKETAYGRQVDGTRQDGFILEAEIIEIKDKPSTPIGEIGMDAFGNKPSFEDRGIRKRILCGIGKQDIEFDSLIPMDNDLIILGGSSDHMILDGENSRIDYQVGDIIRFNLKYGGVLSAMTSGYVHKVIIQ